MRFYSTIRLPFSAALMLAALAWPAVAQETSDLRAEQAVGFYDAGRYADARELLESLDADGAATGPLLYRLSFARRATGDRNGEREALDRALAVLATENENADRIEIPFYLANAMRNAGRSAEARQVAQRATDRFEAGTFPEAATGIEWFRLAKLYQDQARHDDAAKHYRSSLDRFAEAPGTYPANVAWARRYLGNLAYSRGDWTAAADAFRALTGALENPSAADLDRLGAAEARLGEFALAAGTWERAYRRNPSDGDQANYRWKLAIQAASLPSLPATAPDGGSWDDQSRESLESLMRASIDRAKEILAAAAEAQQAGTSAPDEGERRAELDGLRARFLAAAMNYTLRSFPLRETAFTGGFAPHIFHAKRWRWPGDPVERRRRPLGRSKAESDG